jgi:hypothetical protein
MGQGRYKIKLYIGNFVYQDSPTVQQTDQLTFASNKITNKNTVAVESALTIYSRFRTATVTKFANNLFDNNFKTISSLQLIINKKILDSDNGANTILTKEYNFDHLDFNTDLLQFVDWKEQKDTNEIKTSIDPLQCAIAVHKVTINGYKQYSFSATGKLSVYDEYDNVDLSGDELLNKVSNLTPYGISVDQSNDEVVNLDLNGMLMIPSSVSSNVEILRDCSVQNSLGSNYNYDLAPILGKFDYLQSIADNVNF